MRKFVFGICFICLATIAAADVVVIDGKVYKTEPVDATQLVSRLNDARIALADAEYQLSLRQKELAEAQADLDALESDTNR